MRGVGGTPAGRQRGTSRRALTLMDTIITVMIIGILVAVAAPRVARTLQWMRVQSAADRVAADLRLARQHARTQSTLVTVSFSSASRQYKISGVMDRDRPSQPYVVRLDKSPYDLTFLAVDFGGNQDVQFDQYGQPDNGGTVTVACGTLWKTLTLDPDTGKVSIP